MKRIAFRTLGVLALVGIMSLITLDWYLLDGIGGWFWGSVLDFKAYEDTVYAPGYTDKRFRQIQPGMNNQKIIKILGLPLEEIWKYEELENRWISFEDNVLWVWFKNNRVTRIKNHYEPNELSKKIKRGMTKESVLNILGGPGQKFWEYSEGDRSHRIRTIILKNDKVAKTIHEFYVD